MADFKDLELIINGFEVAEKIREQDRHVLIFFLSDRSDKNDRLKGFSLRGNDYLAKPFYPEELIARIKDRFEIGVHENVQEESFHFGNTTFNYTTNEIRTGNNKVLITSRQADLLRILATNLNLAVDRDLLLETVWGTSSYRLLCFSPLLNSQAVIFHRMKKELRHHAGQEYLFVFP